MPLMSNGVLMLEGADPDKPVTVGDSFLPFARTDYTGKQIDTANFSNQNYLVVLLSALTNPAAKDKLLKYRDSAPELNTLGYSLLIVTAGSNRSTDRVINDIRDTDSDGQNKIEGVTFPIIGDDVGEIINTYVRWVDNYTRRDYPVYVVDTTGKIAQIIDGDAINDSEITDLLTRPTPATPFTPKPITPPIPTT